LQPSWLLVLENGNAAKQTLKKNQKGRKNRWKIKIDNLSKTYIANSNVVLLRPMQCVIVWKDNGRRRRRRRRRLLR
jgi:hypothetical protein